jgi:hypothetical protein
MARDQIAWMKQAALECREAEHVSKVCTPAQMSIIGAFAGKTAIARTQTNARHDGLPG